MVEKIKISDGELKRYLVGDGKTKSWTVPKEVKKILSGAFDPTKVSCGYNFEDECDLENWDTCCLIEKIKISAQVEEIQPGAFVGLENLKMFEVDDSCPCACAVDGVLYSKDMSRLICIPAAKEGDIYLADGVKVIGKKSCDGFYKRIILPKSVNEIEGEGFDWCYAEEIYIPETVEKFGRKVFGDLDMWDFEGVIIAKNGSHAAKYASRVGIPHQETGEIEP